MLRSRTRLVTSVAVALAAVTLVVIAVDSQGYPVNHQAANDGAIWLTSDESGAAGFGMFDDPVQQLQTALAPLGGFESSYQLDVLQSGNVVLGEDLLRDQLYGINESAGTLQKPAVPIPGGQNAKVALGGTTAAVLDPANGKVWVADVADGSGTTTAGFDTTGKALDTIPSAVALAVSQDGTVFVASPTELVTFTETDGVPSSPSVSPLPAGLGADLQLTAVGDTPVILDAGHRTVVAGSTVTALPAADAHPGAQLALQQSGPTASTAVVESPSTLMAVGLGGGVSVLGQGNGGAPTAPVRLDDCVHGAWSGSPGRYVRSCSDAPTISVGLGAVAAAQLEFRVNHDNIVLNDVSDGNTWVLGAHPTLAVTSQTWRNILNPQTPNPNSNGTSQENTTETQPQNPKAVDENLEARVGFTSVLHLLDADTDPSGSPLMIVGLSPAQGPGYSVQASPDLQTAVLTLDSSVTNSIQFQYTIMDANGKTASATVTVSPTTAVTPPFEAPIPASNPGPPYNVSSGATASYQVLSTWRDKENDNLVVLNASVPTGTVSWTADGLLTYAAPVEAADTDVTITYSVSNGHGQTTPGTLALVVLGRADTSPQPAIPVDDSTSVTVGTPGTVYPLRNDIPGADPLDANATLALAGPVTPVSGLSVTTNTAQGSVTVTAAEPGVYELTYQDAFGSAPVATGRILIVATAGSGQLREPVTMPTSAILYGQIPTTVNVLANDEDPNGYLLTVTSVDAYNGVGLRVVQGQALRLQATSSSLGSAQFVVDYEVTDGVTQPVTGEVIVTPEPAPSPSLPIARTVTSTVRAGDEVDVPVLASDSDADGEPLTLVPGETTVISGAGGTSQPSEDLGVASVDGADLRYEAPALAPSQTSPEEVTASYVVEDTSGQRTEGQVDFTVNPIAPATDHPPQPPNLTERVRAGGEVTFSIPTSGVDPDGDSVSLVGITSAPQMGRVVSTKADSITYQAFPGSGGTDSFEYTVADRFGETGQAMVEMGITPPSQLQPPVAVNDVVTAAPGARVVVNLLADDVIAAGDTVQIEPLSETNTAVLSGVSLSGDNLVATAPGGATPLVVTYGVTDGSAPASLATVTINAQKGYVAPPVVPNANPSSPAKGSSRLSVDVLANAYNPSGPSNELRIDKVAFPGVHVNGSRLSIPLSDYPQVVPFSVIDAQDPKAPTVAVVHVPAADVGPQLRAGVSPISVPVGGSRTFNINDYVVDPAGAVSLTSSTGVVASPSSALNGQPTSYTSVRLTSVGKFNGPGAVTVQVTDGSSVDAKSAHVADVTIPVQIGPATPIISCPSTPVDLTASGEPIALELGSVCQAWTGPNASRSDLTFTAHWTTPISGVTTGWNAGRHQVLHVTAADSAVKGQLGTLTIGIVGSPSTATLQFLVTGGPPVASVAPIDVSGAQTNRSTSVDVRQYVTSPLQHPQVSIVSLHQLSGPHVPETSKGTVITFTPPTGASGLATFDLAVTDAPGNAQRTVQDTITVNVLDVPGQVPSIAGVSQNHQIALSWPPADDHGAPISDYLVSDGGSPVKVQGTSYTWAGLTNGTSYSFTVTAVNIVGQGKSSAPFSFKPTSVPGAATNLTAVGADGSFQLSWAAAPDNGLTISQYVITVQPAPSSGPATQDVPGSATSYQWSGFSNNVGPYTFSITAVNSAGPGPSASSSAVYAHGVPPAPGAPTAKGTVSPDQTTTTITVTWPAVSPCNDAQPCASYKVTELKGGTVLTTVPGGTGCAGTSCATFGPITNDGSNYTFELQSVNAEGQVSAESPASSPAVIAAGKPATISNLSATSEYESLQVSFTLPASHGAALSEVQYTAANGTAGGSTSGAWQNPGTSGTTVTETIPGLQYNDSYTVTVEACNTNDECGLASNAAVATPYGPPNPPTVTANAGGPFITFGWSGGGGNTRPITQYVVCVDGSCQNKGASGGSEQIAYACSQTHSVYGYVIDDQGHQSANSPTQSAETAACTVGVGEGNVDTGQSYCTQSNCHDIAVTLSNFSPNTQYTVEFSTDCATGNPTTQAQCLAPPDPGTTDYASATVQTDGNGNYSGNPRTFGYAGAHVWVSVNGIPSNTVTWQ